MGRDACRLSSPGIRRATVLGAVFPLALLAAAGRTGFAEAADAPEKVLRAGAHAIDVTPQKFPVIVNGGMLERTCSKVVDPLHARCLVLDDGTTTIAFAVVDNCVIPRSIMDRAKTLAREKTGIPENRILITATHCHSAPSVFGALGSGDNPEYAEYLPGRIAEGIAQAQKNLEPARVGWAVGKDPENVFCRRFLMKPGTAATCRFTGKENDRAQMNPGYQNPNAIERTGPADTDVPVLSVQSLAGRPIAVLANYSTHYAGAPALSADYFGVFARRIGELIGAGAADAAGDGGPPFVGIMTNGTSGDANCCDFVNPRREFTYKTVGEDTAQAAFKAYRTIRYYDWVPIVMEETLLELGVRKPSAKETAEAKAYLAEHVSDGKPKSTTDVYARETVILSEWPERREIKLQAIRIGGLGIAAMPNEVFGSTGLAIKARSPLKPTFSIELANGYAGYIPPPEQHALGGYTTWRARSSCLEEQAEPKIRTKVLELLGNVAGRRTDEKPLPAAAEGTAANGPAAGSSVFAKDNLVAWCIVPFDAAKRGPKQRAEMLVRLGIERVAYDWRAQHVPTFEQEILAYQEHGLEYFAFWGWHPSMASLIEKHGIRPQLWITNPSPAADTQEKRVEAAAKALLPRVELAGRLGCKLGLYNHGGWGGEPDNLVAVCRRLREKAGAGHVGIVYNLHHGHGHIDDFAEVLARMKPYLLCLNLNGMNPGGNPKILPIGRGEHDADMLRVILESGYDGPIGILDHRGELDAEKSLRENLDGLKGVLRQIGDERALRTYRAVQAPGAPPGPKCCRTLTSPVAAARIDGMGYPQEGPARGAGSSRDLGTCQRRQGAGMSTKKVLQRVLSGTADANVGFDDPCQLLQSLDFEMRVRGSHHVFRRAGIEEKINLQREGHEAEPYQVKQVRTVISRYGLAGGEQ